MIRSQMKQIIEDLNDKMIFIVGPRQVGKTWLSKEIGKQFSETVYLNWDNFKDRDIIKNYSWLDSTELVILDEIHKMKYWKNHLKGLWDTKSDKLKILVTGNARLDAFSKGGDSLAGRYFSYRLLPFSLKELQNTELKNNIDLLFERGGFPEPLISQTEIKAKRWRKQYIDSLLREDIIDLTNVMDIQSMKTVLELLRRRVGSPVSYSSIARDVGIAPNTVKKYVSIFESLFIIFRVTPFSRNIGRSILKEPKIYFFDTGMVIDDGGNRIENLVAVSLLKHVYGKNDMLGEEINLHYLRTKDGREVDFCLTEDDKPVKMIEVKTSKENLDKNLIYFYEKYEIPAVQVNKNITRERKINKIPVISINRFLNDLFL